MKNGYTWQPVNVPEPLRAFAKRCEVCIQLRDRVERLSRLLANSDGRCVVNLGHMEVRYDSLGVDCRACANTGWVFGPEMDELFRAYESVRHSGVPDEAARQRQARSALDSDIEVVDEPPPQASSR